MAEDRRVLSKEAIAEQCRGVSGPILRAVTVQCVCERPESPRPDACIVQYDDDTQVLVSGRKTDLDDRPPSDHAGFSECLVFGQCTVGQITIWRE